jgi:hypothetical protein
MTIDKEQKFREAVIILDYLDLKLKDKKYKKILDNYWIHVFDLLYTEEENKFFHENFN